MQIKSIKGVGISSGSNKYEHDDAMEEKTMNVFCDFFPSSSFSPICFVVVCLVLI